MRKAGRQQARAAQQHQAESDLEDHQRVAEPVAARRVAARRFFQAAR
jgi:hypothetical protein